MLAMALSPAAASADGEHRVSAGPLTATISTDPWRVRFDGVLDELPETGPALPGTLGYTSGGTWFHATHVVSEQLEGGVFTAEVATTNPVGPISVRIEPDADGVIALKATAPATASQVQISFAAREGERYLGFGERANAVDQRGNAVENYVSDGPYLEPERAPVATFVPAPGYHPRDDATYFPIPWLLSTAGYGVLLDDDERSEFHLTSDRPDAWSAVVDGSKLNLRVFAGPTPAAALTRFTERLGRQPPAAAPWFFGPWFQPKDGDERSIEVLRNADAPASVGQTYTHYLPCGDQRGNDQRERTALFHAAGLAVTTYFNPMICTGYQPRYDEGAANGYYTKNALGRPYEYRYTGSEQFLVSQFDFSLPAAREFYGVLLGEAVADGYDGWMEDFGEYTPTDAQSSDGTPGTQMHNRYPVLYHQAANEFSRASGKPLARFNRSGWTGAARHSQIVWGGDPSTTWGFDGLQSSLYNGLTMGLSGVSIWGSDIGGFFALYAPNTTSELLIRWIQLGAVSGVMRTQANGFAIPGKERRAQIFDANVLPHWRRYAKLRTQLYPYIAAAERTYDRTGLPIMRHLALVRPRDPQAVARDDEFMFGPHLLAAPVVEEGATQRELYLPRGRWVNLWRAATVAADGSLKLRRARALAGGRALTVKAPLEELPLFVRAGAVLPLLPADVDTLTRYGDAPDIVNLHDRAGRRQLLAFPRGSSRAAIGKGASVRSRETKRGWRLTVKGKRKRTYSLQASLATLKRPFKPCAVKSGGRRLRFSYRKRVLRARVKLRTGSVAALRRCGA